MVLAHIPISFRAARSCVETGHYVRNVKVLSRSNRLCAEKNGYEPKRASYATEGFSAPSPVRVGCNFCCNPLLGQGELLHTQSSVS
jgi:hypothetical protein